MCYKNGGRSKQILIHILIIKIHSWRQKTFLENLYIQNTDKFIAFSHIIQYFVFFSMCSNNIFRQEINQQMVAIHKKYKLVKRQHLHTLRKMLAPNYRTINNHKRLVSLKRANRLNKHLPKRPPPPPPLQRPPTNRATKRRRANIISTTFSSQLTQ